MGDGFVLPRDLPTKGSAPLNAAIIVDDGTDVFRATPAQVVALLPQAGKVYSSLSSFKAASSSNKTQTLQDPTIPFGIFNFETANAPYTTDDLTIIKANDTALTVGAWVRQGAGALTAKASGTGAVSTDIQTPLNALSVLPLQYSSFQNALNAADNGGIPLLVPGASIAVSAPLDIRGKYFRLSGISNKSVFTASGSPAFIVNGESASEVSYSPLSISGIDMDGADVVTTAAISIRYRRNYVFENSLISRAPVGVRLKDANSGILRNVRTSSCAIGLHSVGSNHQTSYESCGFNDSSDVGIKIEALSTGNDGNMAQAFFSCVAQDNARSLEINYNCQAEFYSGYAGEGNSGYVFDNKGGVLTIDGGWFFFDNAAGHYLAHPVGSGMAGQGGSTHFRGSRISSQGSNGLAKLINLTTGEVDLTKNGKVVFEDCDIYSLVAGGGLFNGDPIGTIGPRKGLVARNGRSWSAATSGGTGYTDVVSGNARTVTCTASSPPGFIGFSTPLLSVDYRTDGPMFLILCYQSTKAFVVRTGTAPLAGGGTTLASSVPATGSSITASGWKTFVSCEAVPTALTSGVLEMVVAGSAVNGDAISLLRAGLADADFVNSGGKSGALSNLYFP